MTMAGKGSSSSSATARRDSGGRTMMNLLKVVQEYELEDDSAHEPQNKFVGDNQDPKGAFSLQKATMAGIRLLSQIDDGDDDDEDSGSDNEDYEVDLHDDDGDDGFGGDDEDEENCSLDISRMHLLQLRHPQEDMNNSDGGSTDMPSLSSIYFASRSSFVSVTSSDDASSVATPYHSPMINVSHRNMNQVSVKIAHHPLHQKQDDDEEEEQLGEQQEGETLDCLNPVMKVRPSSVYHTDKNNNNKQTLRWEAENGSSQAGLNSRKSSSPPPLTAVQKGAPGARRNDGDESSDLHNTNHDGDKHQNLQGTVGMSKVNNDSTFQDSRQPQQRSRVTDINKRVSISSFSLDKLPSPPKRHSSSSDASLKQLFASMKPLPSVPIRQSSLTVSSEQQEDNSGVLPLVMPVRRSSSLDHHSNLFDMIDDMNQGG